MYVTRGGVLLRVTCRAIFTSYFSRNVRNVRGSMTVNGQRATGARTRQTAGHHRSTCARRCLPRRASWLMREGIRAS